MSETVLPNDDLQPTPEASDSSASAPGKRSGNGLAVLALLLGAAGVVVGCVRVGHDLHPVTPFREITALNGIKQIALCIVRVSTCKP